MTFSNLGDGQFPLYAPMVMMFVDFLVFGLLAVYFDNVYPSKVLYNIIDKGICVKIGSVYINCYLQFKFSVLRYFDQTN